MKKYLGVLLREQKGQALTIVLAMLALGSLVISPFLSLMATSLKSGQREESRIYEHYAANAGISDGLQQILVSNPALPAVGENWSYSIPDTNSRTVTVTITHVDARNWQIDSTATSSNGHSTKLSCYGQWRIPPNAITSTSVNIRSGATINGNVQWDSAIGTLSNAGTINGQIIDSAVAWPTTEEVSFFYLELVDSAPTYEGDLTLTLTPSTDGHPYSLGPIYIHGNLTVDASSSGAFRLDGTVYVTGNVIINPNVKYLQNNNSLYSDGNGGILLNDGSSLRDAGCIVARQNIALGAAFTSTSYSVVWSLKGSVSSTASGSPKATLFSGDSDTAGIVTVDAGKIITYVEPSPDLPLPPLPHAGVRVVRWESSSG